MMTGIIRTLLGDLPAESAKLGRCDAHEHVILAGDFIRQHYPALLLDDVDVACDEVSRFHKHGGGWMVDSMPTGPGRHAAMLAEVAQRSRVPIVMPTGRHLAQYYPQDHPMPAMDGQTLADLFVEEIERGVDNQYRCGVIKVAAGKRGVNDMEREAFLAAAEAQRRTGCPILTHTEADEGAFRQVEILRQAGADLSHIILSHCDKNDDVIYHRDLLQTGVHLEYDQHFRQCLFSRRSDPCPSIRLIAQLAPQFPDQIMLGMDIARREYWPGYGGQPGLAWLVQDLPKKLQQAGVASALIHRLYFDNPASAFTFVARPEESYV